MNYIKKLYNIFVKSLKQLDKKLLSLAFYDLLVYILLFSGVSLIIFVFNLLAASRIKVMSQFQQGFNTLPLEQLQYILANAKEFLLLIIITFILIIVFTILIFSLFKGLIWKKLLNKEFSKKFFSKFFITNLVWIIPVIALLLAAVFMIMSFLQDQYVLMQVVKLPINIIIYLTLYFHVFFTYNLALTNNVKESLKKMFYYGIIKIHLLLPPILIVLLILYLITKLYALFTIQNFMFNIIIYLIVMSFIFVFTRLFLINSIKELT